MTLSYNPDMGLELLKMMLFQNNLSLTPVIIPVSPLSYVKSFDINTGVQRM